MNEGMMAIFFMFFMTPVMIISMILGHRYYMTKMKLQTEALNKNGEKWAGEVIARLEKLERRMANVETLVLDAEKKREFERI